MLHMLACHLDQVVAVPHQGTYRTHLAIGTEGRMQQSHRMQMLNPLALVKVGAPARHILHVPRIYQARLDAVLLKHVVHRNPVNSSRFHRRRSDATTDQPVSHLVQIAGKGLALPDGWSSRSAGTATRSLWPRYRCPRHWLKRRMRRIPACLLSLARLLPASFGSGLPASPRGCFGFDIAFVL